MRLAIWGTGAIAGRFVHDASLVPGVRVTHVCSRRTERAARFTAATVPQAHPTTADEMLADRDVDAVYVATPNDCHMAHARAALRAGKHVLLEKPAVPTAGQWTDLTAEARERGLVIVEAMRTAYDPGMHVVRSAMSRLGTLHRASLRFEKRSTRYDSLLAGAEVPAFDPTRAGGALLDLGVYCVHAQVALFGVPTEVNARFVRVRTGADGAGVVMAVHDGLVVDLAFSKMATSTVPSQISGELGVLSVDHIASPRRVQLDPTRGPVEQWVVDAPAHTLTPTVERFVHLVSTGQQPSLDQDRTSQTLQVLDAVRRSADADGASAQVRRSHGGSPCAALPTAM